MKREGLPLPKTPSVEEAPAEESVDEKDPHASDILSNSIEKLSDIVDRLEVDKESIQVSEINAILTELKVARHQTRTLERNARIDAWTGLLNRGAFFKAADVEIARMRRAKQEGETQSLYFARVDLDNFKMINDIFGHAVGDMYLKKIAAHMQNAVRATDTLARMGGDEFSLLFPYLTYDGIDTIKEKLLLAVRNGAEEAMRTLMLEQPDLDASKLMEQNVTASIGLALYDDFDQNGKDMDDRADALARLAKHAGKDRIVDDDQAVVQDPDGLIRANRSTER